MDVVVARWIAASQAVLRRWGGPDPEIVDLCAQIDALAYERDELVERVAALRVAMAQQRRDMRANVLTAYEPERGPTLSIPTES